MKKSTCLTVALLLVFCVAPQFLSAQDASQQRQWTLDNGVVRKVLRFTGDGLETKQWTDLQSNINFVKQASLHTS